MRIARGRWAALVLALLLCACGPDVYEAHGVIREVLPDEYRVLIEHDEIPGFMEAMTMHFEVPSSELLARMQAGQEIDFRIESQGGRVRIVDFRVAEPSPE